jgi:son of sevenless-like protein
LRNYNGVMEIISALHSSSIARMKQTWALIPEHLMEKLETLNTLMSPNDNFKNYREALRSISSTCIPYLGLWLADLTFIDDGNPDTIDPEKLINYEKAAMTAKR